MATTLPQFSFNGTTYNKPISLLGSMNTIGSTQTTTPMGVTAKTPTANVKPPPSTLPTGQANQSNLTVGPSSTISSVAGPQLTDTQKWAQQHQNAPTPQQALTADPSLVAPQSAPMASAPVNAPQAQNQPQAGTSGPSTTNPVTYGGLLGQAAKVASGPSADYLAQEANANQYNEALKRSRMNEAQGLADNANNPIPLQFQQGRAQVLQGQYAQEQAALGSAFQGASTLQGAANTQQGLQQSGLLGAAAGAAPVQVSPGNYLQSPLSGGAATSGQGQAQGIQAATNWAIAQQNMAQGRNYQGISQELSNAIQTMAPIGQKLTDFITATGQNPATSPLVNEQIGKVNAQLYPAQAATLNAAVNDIRSYAVQILGSQSGANPTDVTSAVNSFDFSKFSAKDLGDFLSDLNNLGMTRLSQAQSAMNAGYSANNTVGTPAAGVTATDQGAFNTGSMTPSNNFSNLTKAVVGSIANIAGTAINAAGGVVSNAAGGAVGGAAAELFLP